MDAEQFSVYRHEAVHQLMRLNEDCENNFRISSSPRWEYDLEAGTLTFSEKGIPKVIAEIQVAGSTSISGGTWLWGWANENLPSKVTHAIAFVKAFGEAQNISELTQESMPDDEYLGWEMTAVAARILGSKGAYRCPHENGCLYIVYTSLRFAGEKGVKASDAKQIECSTHGSGFSTYVCEHLGDDPAQEWFSQEPDGTNRWPDA